MLAVAVDLRGEVEALAVRQLQPGLHRAADPEILAQPQQARAVRPRDLGGPVGRAVVDDHRLERDAGGSGQRLDLVEQATERRLLVERRDDDEEPHDALRGSYHRGPTPCMVR